MHHQDVKCQAGIFDFVRVQWLSNTGLLPSAFAGIAPTCNKHRCDWHCRRAWKQACCRSTRQHQYCQNAWKAACCNATHIPKDGTDGFQSVPGPKIWGQVDRSLKPRLHDYQETHALDSVWTSKTSVCDNHSSWRITARGFEKPWARDCNDSPMSVQ